MDMSARQEARATTPNTIETFCHALANIWTARQEGELGPLRIPVPRHYTKSQLSIHREFRDPRQGEPKIHILAKIEKQ